MSAAQLPFEAECEFPVFYRDTLLCRQRIDLVIASRLIVEIKAVDRINPVHQAQILSYLRVSKMKIGLLVNFNVPVLKEGIKRIVS